MPESPAIPSITSLANAGAFSFCKTRFIGVVTNLKAQLSVNKFLGRLRSVLV